MFSHILHTFFPANHFLYTTNTHKRGVKMTLMTHNPNLKYSKQRTHVLAPIIPDLAYYLAYCRSTFLYECATHRAEQRTIRFVQAVEDSQVGEGKNSRPPLAAGLRDRRYGLF